MRSSSRKDRDFKNSSTSTTQTGFLISITYGRFYQKEKQKKKECINEINNIKLYAIHRFLLEKKKKTFKTES
jgi:hypothetical protein